MNAKTLFFCKKEAVLSAYSQQPWKLCPSLSNNSQCMALLLHKAARWFLLMLSSINQKNLLKYLKVKCTIKKKSPKIKGKVVFSSVPYLNFEMLQLNYVNRMLPFTASFTHRRGQILSQTFYRQIEHKDCDQVMEKCLILMNVYSPILVTPASTC